MRLPHPAPCCYTVLNHQRIAAKFLVVAAFLTFLAGLLPQNLQAKYIGEMDGFWRRATMVDTWLKGGGGLGAIPN
jgi:hypothetical protein